MSKPTMPDTRKEPSSREDNEHTESRVENQDGNGSSEARLMLASIKDHGMEDDLRRYFQQPFAVKLRTFAHSDSTITAEGKEWVSKRRKQGSC